MKTITTPIIPTKQTFYKVDALHELDLKAICVFTAIGFFLDQDTYYQDTKVLRPATEYTLDSSNKVLNSKSYFNWHYSPRDISFENALEEFSILFESIIKEQTNGKKVILPLSGGLDSRTQAAALKALGADVSSYSYEFIGGYPETKVAKEMAKACDFEFQDHKIKQGYLWNVIEDLAELNKCYSDFTSPRQMAICNNFNEMGDVFSLGHWGDVLFDSMNLSDLSHEQQVEVLISKLLKRGGLEFASLLWQEWGLEGHFKDYFRSRISELLNTIDIDNTNARLRAFKSIYWAPRWTSVNLSVFRKYKPITLPYYDDRMCQFICTIPESFLKGRQLQIAYIKKRMPQLAKMEWQDQRPFNLYNYRMNKVPYNIPYKLKNKFIREIKAIFGTKYIQRNWELQFLGDSNKKHLKQLLYNDKDDKFMRYEFIKKQCDLFYNHDAIQNAHAVNMILVLKQFNNQHRNSG